MPAESNARFTEQWNALDPWDRDYPHLWIKAEHLGRYIFAARYLAAIGAAQVADIACGRGYGSRELADTSERVVGIDHDAVVIASARRRYGHPRVSFEVATVANGSLGDLLSPNSLSAIVSFETIEHLIDPQRGLEEFAGLLRPSGHLFLSVPNAAHEHLDDFGLPTNREHKRTFTASSIIDLAQSAGFETIEVLGQPLIGEISRTETRLIRRKQLDGRIGDEPALHTPETMRRLAMVMGTPQPRDVERSYSLTLVCRRTMQSQ